MKKAICMLLFITILCCAFSSEPKNNLGQDAINLHTGEKLFNHGVHTWISSDTEGTLVCMYCGETWELSTIDKIHRSIKYFEYTTHTRLEVILPLFICGCIFLITAVCVIISKVKSAVRFRQSAEEFMNLIKTNPYTRRKNDKIFDDLLQKEIKTKYDLEEVRYIYNEGNLRTQEEIDDYIYEQNLNRFNSSRHIVNFCFFFFPFVITFCLVFFGVKDFFELWFIGIPLSLLPAILVSVITMIIGYNINISNAKYIYHLSGDEPSVQKEVLKKKVGIASALVSGAYSIHTVKKGLKEVSDVDSWKEMK